MSPLEIEIQTLEASLSTIKQTIAILTQNGSVPNAILQQKSVIEKQLKQKRAQLAAQQNETVYEHLSRIVGYSPELKQCIEETVEHLLAKNIPNASDPGLLLGKIQCGKTRAFVGVMGLAFDKGIDTCVVLTKSDDGLVEQTLARMEYEFRDFLSNTNMNQCCVIGVHKMDKGMSFTPLQINQKNIFIVYKNTTRLDYLINLFTNTNFKNKKVLIIDDEADFVSRAYYQKNANVEVGRIALKIDQFAHIPAFCRYLQVTATPYSLFLQPDHTVQVSNGRVEPFRPRFTTLVPIHQNYIGGKQYFVLSQNSASMYSYLKHIISDECIGHLLSKNKDARVYNNAQNTPKYLGLRQALMSYIVASAVRQLQEENLRCRRYNSSFFMHISTETVDHQFEKLVVDNILNAWANDVKNTTSGLYNLQGCALYTDFLQAYNDLVDSNTAGNNSKEIDIYMPSEQEVRTRFVDIFIQGSYAVQIVNSLTSGNLLGKDGQLKLTSPLNIFIGGFKLDRGITIDHMLGFMYGRNPQRKQTDTVLQHHRMYGNRSKEDMAVTRLHTTQSLYSAMEWIDNMDHQLREVFVNAMQNPGNPIPLVAIQYSNQRGIIPCGRNRLLISDLDTFDSFKRFSPLGFQTGSATAIRPTIAEIDAKLQNAKGYTLRTPFLIDKQIAYDIIHKIRSTFVYNRPIDNNAGLEWDEKIMIAAIEKYAPKDGKIWCYVVDNRNLARIKRNGTFADAPEDGNTDTPVARMYTQGANARPFMMFIKENGDATLGWRGAPFYWPSLRLPQGIQSCMFCL